jgi:hypothetical protein
LKEILAPHGGRFPPPTKEGIGAFLKWDDWRILGTIDSGGGGAHGKILKERNHYRCVYETPETPTSDDLARFDEIDKELEAIPRIGVPAEKSWYQPKRDILVNVRDGTGEGRPHVERLSQRSPIVAGMLPINQRRIYVPADQRKDAMHIVQRITGGKK